MFTTAFWKASFERAVKTFAQSLVAVGLVDAGGLLDVGWTAALSAAGLAALISVLTSVASDAATGGGPSLTNAESIEG